MDAKQDEVRLHELSLIPKSKRTPEESKEYAKLHARKSRRRLSTDSGWKKLFDRAERAETQQEFWQLNRAEETQEQLDAWLAQHEAIEDQLHWMANAASDSPDDELYVSLAEGIDVAEDTIAKNGFIKETNFNSRALQDFSPTWAIWCDRILDDAIWGLVEPYWKNQEVLAALVEENAPTNIWALYGFRVSLPEYHYKTWKSELWQKVPVTSPVLELLR